jgi:hypothetical protein
LVAKDSNCLPRALSAKKSGNIVSAFDNSHEKIRADLVNAARQQVLTNCHYFKKFQKKNKNTKFYFKLEEFTGVSEAGYTLA